MGLEQYAALGIRRTDHQQLGLRYRCHCRPQGLKYLLVGIDSLAVPKSSLIGNRANNRHAANCAEIRCLDTDRDAGAIGRLVAIKTDRRKNSKQVVFEEKGERNLKRVCERRGARLAAVKALSFDLSCKTANRQALWQAAILCW